MIVKTGILSGYTTLQYGNGYLDVMRFKTPFPNRILTVQITPMFVNGGSYPAVDTRMPMLDWVKKEGFRAMYPGENRQTVHSLSWLAIGF